MPLRKRCSNGLGSGTRRWFGTYLRKSVLRSTPLAFRRMNPLVLRSFFSLGGVTFHGLSGRLQRELQRFPRDARDERFDQPAESLGNVPRQRSHFALHVNAAIALLHPPPGLHPPEVSTVALWRFLAFIAFPGVFHFRDAHGRAPAVRLPRRIVEVVHRMLRVQHHGDHLEPAKAQENLEMVAI